MPAAVALILVGVSAFSRSAAVIRYPDVSLVCGRPLGLGRFIMTEQFLISGLYARRKAEGYGNDLFYAGDIEIASHPQVRLFLFL
jgi:hypothetical protein